MGRWHAERDRAKPRREHGEREVDGRERAQQPCQAPRQDVGAVAEAQDHAQHDHGEGDTEDHHDQEQ